MSDIVSRRYSEDGEKTYDRIFGKKKELNKQNMTKIICAGLLNRKKSLENKKYYLTKVQHKRMTEIGIEIENALEQLFRLMEDAKSAKEYDKAKKYYETFKEKCNDLEFFIYSA